MESLVCNLCGGSRIQEVTRKNGFPIVQCKDCSLLFAVEKERKRSEEIDSTEHITEEYFTERYPKFQLIERYADSIDGERDREILHRLHAFGVHGTLLDVGAGLGLFLDVARREGWSAVGVEPSPWACRFAQERLSVDVVQGTLLSAGFPEASFDAVVCQHVLSAVRDPSAFLREIYRVLRADGILVLVSGVRPISLAGRIGGTFFISPEAPSTFFGLSWRTVERYLKVNGFAEILAREMNFSVALFVDAVRRRLTNAAKHHKPERGKLVSSPVMKGAPRTLHRILKPVINKVATAAKIGDMLTIFARRGA